MEDRDDGDLLKEVVGRCLPAKRDCLMLLRPWVEKRKVVAVGTLRAQELSRQHAMIVQPAVAACRLRINGFTVEIIFDLEYCLLKSNIWVGNGLNGQWST